MALTIGELVGIIRTDDSGMRRGLAQAELRMRGFQVDTEGRLRHLDGRFATTAEQIAMGFRRGTDEGHRFSLSLGRIAGMAGGLMRVAGSVGKIAAMLGGAVPVAAGLVATLANIAPAAGVGVTGMLALQQATFAVKLGTQGMDKALAAALDPAKADKFEEELKKLSPEAREFARAVRDLGPEFRKLQQDVQNELFRGLAENLQRTAKVVLPVLRRELHSTALALGDMAAGAMGAARDLAANGTLGKAMNSASMGLRNLSGLPSIVVTALGQIAAAAGPSFEGLTAAAAHSANQIGQKLGAAFESGRMQEAIQNAIDLIGDLVDVGMNVGRIIGSIFSAAQVSGGGFVGTLQQITGALAEAFASAPVQDGLKALFGTMSVLAKTVAPLLGQALGIIAPILTELGPPVQTLVKALGDALHPIIKALGPVLVAAARAVGSLVEALAPLLPVVGDLVAALLPALKPLLDAVNRVFRALAPVVEQVAGILEQSLSPILAELPGIIEPLAKVLADRLVFFLQLLGDILAEVGPSLVTLGQSAAELLVAVSPLIVTFSELTNQLLVGLMPVLVPTIKLVGALATMFAGGLAAAITHIVVPALEDLTGWFQGMKTALQPGIDAVKWFTDRVVGLFRWLSDVLVGHSIVPDMVSAIVRVFAGLPGRAAAALASLGGRIASVASSALRSMGNAIGRGLSSAISQIKGLPGRARSALGGLGGVLYGAGQSLISGFISGLKSMFGSVKSTLGSLTSSLTSWKGPEDVDKRILIPAGRMVIAGFQRGIADQTPALRAQLQGLTGEVPGMALGGLGGGRAAAGGGVSVVRLELAGPEEVRRLIRGIVNTTAGGDVQLAFGRRR